MGNAAKKKSFHLYGQFDKIAKEHPLYKKVQDSCIPYQARVIRKARVGYFNFELAKEMGLIDEKHPHKMNPELEEKIIDTFSIRIINEYDKVHNVNYQKRVIKENTFIATRYLQLQHDSKTGKTSGDGRCVWSGTVKRGRVTWDINSRGIGVTALAPGVVKLNKPIKSGTGGKYGYDCGMAELDELFGAALNSKFFHLMGVNTERVLAIIDHGKNLGVGVRAGTNLLRPAHLFVYLKQGRYDELKKLTDYLIERQNKNNSWNFSSDHQKKYDLMLNEICISFAKQAALFERNYIFVWMEWDGDNILCDGGIIDYGSIRHLGLRHDQYKYDDVERFSTNLNQQRIKAKIIVQSFAQLCDFLKRKYKKPLKKFKNHKVLKDFDKIYENELLKIFLNQIGFDEVTSRRLLGKHRKKVERMYHHFSKLEKIKLNKKTRRIEDGINNPAFINMRKYPAVISQRFLENIHNFKKYHPNPKEIFYKIRSKKGHHKKPTLSILRTIKKCGKAYKELILQTNLSPKTILEKLNEATSNQVLPLTGDGSIFIIEILMKKRKEKSISYQEMQTIIDNLACFQFKNINHLQKKLSPRVQEIIDECVDIIEDYSEEI